MTLTTPKPLDPNPWSPITDVRKPDLEVMQESAWRKKDTSYRSPARSETEKEMEERKNYDTPVLMFFFSLRTGISHLQSLCQKKSVKHLSLAGTATFWKDPFCFTCTASSTLLIHPLTLRWRKFSRHETDRGSRTEASWVLSEYWR